MNGNYAQYQLIRPLSKGGMGEIFLAKSSSGQQVVIKRLLPHLAQSKSVILRFKREQNLQSKLNHNRIVPIIDVGMDGNAPFSVMPYIQGQSLHERLSAGRPLSVHQANRVTNDIGAALAFAHQHGVLHRDIKPNNILLTGEGAAYLIDFGIATEPLTEEQSRLTSIDDHAGLGTRLYMAPEVLQQGMPASIYSEVYSFGTTVYEMLTARAYAKALTEQGHSLYQNVPTALASVLQLSTNTAPSQRYPSIAHFLSAFNEAVQSISYSSRNVSPLVVQNFNPSPSQTPAVRNTPSNTPRSSSKVPYITPKKQNSGVAIFLVLALLIVCVILLFLSTMLSGLSVAPTTIRQQLSSTTTQVPTLVSLQGVADATATPFVLRAVLVTPTVQNSPPAGGATPVLAAWGRGHIVTTISMLTNIYRIQGGTELIGIANYNTRGQLTGQYYYDPIENSWQWEVTFTNGNGWASQDDLSSITLTTTLPLESWDDSTSVRNRARSMLRTDASTRANGQTLQPNTRLTTRSFVFNEGIWWWQVTTDGGLAGWIPQSELYTP